ncbi:MAG: 5-formyltetrahydrofolate cyclo-ligase [Caulobacteraceae bacterium]
MASNPPDFAKIAMRAALRRRRRRLALACPDAATRAAEALPLDRLAPFAVVAGYRPIGGEMDPEPVLARLLAAGAVLALPAAVDRRGPLEFRAVRPRDTPIMDIAGVPAPPPGAPRLAPGIVIAPLLAFDREGGRLGQGGGHYDRTIAALRAAGPVLIVGLAFAGQEVARVPREAHDERLDAILTETGYIEV